MLNPSTADAEIDDPTIRRCIGFAKTWNLGSSEVVNLFAFRATDPKELLNCIDPIGPENDIHIHRALVRNPLVITSWGTKGGLHSRNKHIMKMLSPHIPMCLEVTKDGHPKHLLYVAGSCEPTRYFGGRSVAHA